MNLMESTTSGAWVIKGCSTPMTEGLIDAAAAAALANDAVVFNATDTRSDTRFDGRLVGLLMVAAKLGLLPELWSSELWYSDSSWLPELWYLLPELWYAGVCPARLTALSGCGTTDATSPGNARKS